MYARKKYNACNLSTDLFQFSAVLKSPFNQLLGTPEHTRLLAGDYVPTFAADEAKRDAVVEAFKVRHRTFASSSVD